MIVQGDCMDALAALPDAFADAIVTDPPYGLGFMGKAWDDLPPGVEWARECLRVLKPGGYALAFGGTRTYHRLACAIEDAGFEIRDTICWLYGSGFPKSLDVSKAIDKAAGATRKVVGTNPNFRDPSANTEHHERWNGAVMSPDITAPTTPDAERWKGWGTALKPAHEPIVVARKSLAGTVAANVLAHGTGAINVDGCRVAFAGDADRESAKPGGAATAKAGALAGGSQHNGERSEFEAIQGAGRWPANVALDEDAAAMLDDGVSRFFYVAKASRRERNAGVDAGNSHPTVKPVALMRWLVRLVTPSGGLIIDPFAGSGTTGIAAALEGFGFVGVELDAEFVRIAEARMTWWTQQRDDDDG